MRVLITGSNGFIGKYVTAQLLDNNEVLAMGFREKESDIQKENISWVYGDLANLEAYKNRIKIFNPDVVVHLAWQGIPDFSEGISRLNLDNSLNLFDFIIEETNCKRIIVSGSCFEYGEKNGEVNEKDNTTINSYFSWAKQSLYRYLEFKSEQKNIDLIWFRYFYVYGLGQRKESLIPMILNSLANGVSPDIRNLYNKNDFIFSKDIALATDFIVNYKGELESGIYNLGSGYSTSVMEICKKAEFLLTGRTEITEGLLSIPIGDFSNFWADISKMKNLGWNPVYSIEDGINEIINH
ncbi:MAG: NAD(P)-dependent oxidoreductase [Bacteroidales bacterium]|nr:NAD(P)-dependent oxidoreductase [Bacteroidales bacterium]